MALTDEELVKLLAVWDIQALAADQGPAVAVAVRGTFMRRLRVEEARALARRLWDVADEAEGFTVSKTEPSPSGPSEDPSGV